MQRELSVLVVSLSLFLIGGKVNAHEQPVHQYITREAFKLLQMSFPGKSPEAITKPSGTPARDAIRVAILLTFRDTMTMSSNSGSKEATSRIADRKLSTRSSIIKTSGSRYKI